MFLGSVASVPLLRRGASYARGHPSTHRLRRVAPAAAKRRNGRCDASLATPPHVVFCPTTGGTDCADGCCRKKKRKSERARCRSHTTGDRRPQPLSAAEDAKSVDIPVRRPLQHRQGQPLRPWATCRPTDAPPRTDRQLRQRQGTGADVATLEASGRGRGSRGGLHPGGKQVGQPHLAPLRHMRRLCAELPLRLPLRGKAEASLLPGQHPKEQQRSAPQHLMENSLRHKTSTKIRQKQQHTRRRERRCRSRLLVAHRQKPWARRRPKRAMPGRDQRSTALCRR